MFPCLGNHAMTGLKVSIAMIDPKMSCKAPQLSGRSVGHNGSLQSASDECDGSRVNDECGDDFSDTSALR